jgi:hypothetical protein
VTVVDVAFAETLSLMQPGDTDDVDLFASLLQRPAWMAEGACRSAGGQVSQSGTPAAERQAVNFFPGRGESAAPAKAVCRRCPVRSACLEFALEHDAVGIWGGTSERQRRQLVAGVPWSEQSAEQRQAIVARALAPRVAKERAPTPPASCRHCGAPISASKRFCNVVCRNRAGKNNGGPSDAGAMLREMRERLGSDAIEARVARAFARRP